MIIHIMGASGTGTTSIGAALAKALSYNVIESDFYKWKQTVPAFQEMRPLEESNALLLEQIEKNKNLIIAGSLHANPVTFAYIDLIIYLYAPTRVRMRRIKRRDKLMGYNSMKQDESVRRNFKDFLWCAKNYDNLAFDGRSKLSQEYVISSCNAPVIRINTNKKFDKIMKELLTDLKSFEKLKQLNPNA